MSEQHLEGDEARKKMQEIAEHQSAMFCTIGDEHVVSTRPMFTQAIDEDGTFHFFSGRTSNHNQHIAMDVRVTLIYANPSKSEYLAIEGRADISRDPALIERLWTPLVRVWFEDKSDPDLTVLSVTPTAGHYWDTKSNRVVQLVKLAIGAIVGKPFDDGREGDLKV